MALGDLLKQARILRGLTQSELAKKSGVTPQMILKYESGDSMPRDLKLQALSNALNLDLKYYVEHNKTLNPSDLKKQPAVHNEVSPSSIPYVVKYSNPLVSEEPEAYINVPQFKGCLKFEVTDDSMADSLYNGDVIAALPVEFNKYFRPNRIYVAQLDDDYTINRVVPSEREGFLTFISDNDFYQPFEVPKSEIVTMYLYKGKVTRADTNARTFRMTNRIQAIEEQVNLLAAEQE